MYALRLELPADAVAPAIPPVPMKMMKVAPRRDTTRVLSKLGRPGTVSQGPALVQGTASDNTPRNESLWRSSSTGVSNKRALFELRGSSRYLQQSASKHTLAYSRAVEKHRSRVDGVERKWLMTASDNVLSKPPVRFDSMSVDSDSDSAVLPEQFAAYDESDVGNTPRTRLEVTRPSVDSCPPAAMQAVQPINCGVAMPSYGQLATSTVVAPVRVPFSSSRAGRLDRHVLQDWNEKITPKIDVGRDRRLVDLSTFDSVGPASSKPATVKQVQLGQWGLINEEMQQANEDLQLLADHEGKTMRFSPVQTPRASRLAASGSSIVQHVQFAPGSGGFQANPDRQVGELVRDSLSEHLTFAADKSASQLPRAGYQTPAATTVMASIRRQAVARDLTSSQNLVISAKFPNMTR